MKSIRRCAHDGCPELLKENVVERKPTARLCFKHYRENEALKGHDMSTAREVRQGKKPAKKYRETIAETKKKLALEALTNKK
jgi:hypothetical protein